MVKTKFLRSDLGLASLRAGHSWSGLYKVEHPVNDNMRKVQDSRGEESVTRVDDGAGDGEGVQQVEHQGGHL